MLKLCTCNTPYLRCWEDLYAGDPLGPVLLESTFLVACRLLNGPGEVFGIQFATGLLLKRGSLYISYGITDCFAGLVVIKDFQAKLRLWEAFGIGSQGT